MAEQERPQKHGSGGLTSVTWPMTIAVNDSLGCGAREEDRGFNLCTPWLSRPVCLRGPERGSIASFGFLLLC
jgi:hypothetical protein